MKQYRTFTDDDHWATRQNQGKHSAVYHLNNWIKQNHMDYSYKVVNMAFVAQHDGCAILMAYQPKN